MEEIKKDKTVFGIGVVLSLLFLSLTVREIHDSVTAKTLETNCTRKTLGIVCETGEISNPKDLAPTIEYVVVEYEVNDILYTTKGIGKETVGTEIMVWYNPESPKESYAGHSPIKDSIGFVVLHLILYCIGLILSGMFVVKYKQ